MYPVVPRSPAQRAADSRYISVAYYCGLAYSEFGLLAAVEDTPQRVDADGNLQFDEALTTKHSPVPRVSPLCGPRRTCDSLRRRCSHRRSSTGMTSCSEVLDRSQVHIRQASSPRADGEPAPAPMEAG